MYGSAAEQLVPLVPAIIFEGGSTASQGGRNAHERGVACDARTP